MGPSEILQVIALATAGAAVVAAFRTRHQQNEEIIELLWHLNTQMAELRGDKEAMNGLRTRSGHPIRPR